MDENISTAVEAEETELDTELDEAFDAEWGDAPADDDDFDLTDGEEAAEPEDQREEADEPEETDEKPAETEQEPQSEEAETPPAEEKPQDQRFHLKHNDEELDVDAEQVVALAQKGMDYDRVRQERDNFKTQYPKLSQYESFLKELAEASGTDIPGLMEQTRASMLVQKAKAEGKELSEAAAIEQIRAEGRKAAEQPAEPEEKKPEEKKPEEDADAQRRKAIQAFVAAYPTVKAEEIPQEVWTESFRTGDLAGAYARWENRKLKAENEQLKQNQKNKERSTGSRRSAGATTPKDDFDDAWDSL